jgi:hypothetical protein
MVSWLGEGTKQEYQWVLTLPDPDRRSPEMVVRMYWKNATIAHGFMSLAGLHEDS